MERGLEVSEPPLAEAVHLYEAMNYVDQLEPLGSATRNVFSVKFLSVLRCAICVACEGVLVTSHDDWREIMLQHDVISAPPDR